MNCCAQIAAHAHAALIAEVDATPKPGLVDRRNSGAHTDMDRALFHKSAEALQPYFLRVAQHAYDTAALTPTKAFSAMRPLGIQAEADMLRATGGVNTHKGAIFSLGLLAAAAARLHARNACPQPEAVLDEACLFAAGICARELPTKPEAVAEQEGVTKGERAFRLYGARGVRGEAEQGFPHVRGCALPAYLAALQAGAGENDALIMALLALMAEVTDTNVLMRADMDAANYVKEQARMFLDQQLPLGSVDWQQALMRMDDVFIQRNLSPGGCADLVALTHFLHACSSSQIK